MRASRSRAVPVTSVAFSCTEPTVPRVRRASIVASSSAEGTRTVSDALARVHSSPACSDQSSTRPCERETNATIESTAARASFTVMLTSPSWTTWRSSAVWAAGRPTEPGASSSTTAAPPPAGARSAPDSSAPEPALQPARSAARSVPVATSAVRVLGRRRRAAGVLVMTVTLGRRAPGAPAVHRIVTGRPAIVTCAHVP